MRSRWFACLAITCVAGCGFYFGDDDPCDDVDYGGTRAGDRAFAPGQRNPETGECEYLGSPVPCDSECGPCVAGGGVGPTEGDGPTDLLEEPGESEPIALPSWGYCESQCTGLAENTCLATSGCRGIYVGDSINKVYADCWSTDQTGPIQGSCQNLDATTCSMHDDCVAVHSPTCGELPPGDLREPACIGGFLRCESEGKSCASEADCGPNERCNAAEVCLPNPSCDPGGACDQACYGVCLPDDPGGPGDCYAPVTCDAAPPLCPPGTTGGIRNGCWTGYCIPLDDCESKPACGAITTEMTCIARTDCAPLYEGVGCTCTATGCTCADWVFTSCSDD
jgi:hypothetical protein